MTDQAVQESENQLTLSNFAAAESQSKEALKHIQAQEIQDVRLLIRALDVCMQSLYQQRR